MTDTKPDLTGLTVSFLDYRKVASLVDKKVGFNIDDTDVVLAVGDEKYRGFWDFLIDNTDIRNNGVFHMPEVWKWVDGYVLSEDEKRLELILNAFLDYGDIYYISW